MTFYNTKKHQHKQKHKHETYENHKKNPKPQKHYKTNLINTTKVVFWSLLSLIRKHLLYEIKWLEQEYCFMFSFN